MKNMTYRFKTPKYPRNILYVNLIANYACTNNCRFCSREDAINKKKNIYEKKAKTSLYLPKSPSVDEIVDAIGRDIREDDQELAIIGLGEPLIYFSKVAEVIKRVKEKYNIKTRIDTNGVTNKSAEQLQGLDEIRISLNAVNEQEYNELCRPKVENAFLNLVNFVKSCANSTIDTYVSFVVGFKGTRTKEEYAQYAESLGVKKKNIIFRNYVKLN
ncbi:radical SAM protein [Nanoarchaeota archaeon]